MYAPSVTDTLLTATGATDDTTWAPSFGLSGFTVYGTPVTPSNFIVNNNGFVSFGGGTISTSTTSGSGWGGANNYTNLAMPFSSTAPGVAMIAPMWDDLYETAPGVLNATDQSVRVANPGTGIMTVTWQGEEAFLNATPNLNFQLVMFGTGNSFGTVAGTFTFCYDAENPGTATFSPTVGVNKGDGLTFNSFALGGNGAVGNNATITGLANTRWTFTPNGTGGYNVTPGSPVPEPASMSALAIGALALLRRRKKA